MSFTLPYLYQQTSWLAIVAALFVPLPKYIERIKIMSQSPIIAAIVNDLPVLIAGTKAIAKALLDAVYTTGTPDEKAAQLTAQLQPGFDAEMAKLNLPSWATGMLDGIFGRLVVLAVQEVEAGV